MKHARITLATLMLALLMVGSAAGQELDGTLKKIKASSTLTLGYLESAPPFSFPGPDQKARGLFHRSLHARRQRHPETTRDQSETQLGSGHD